jgi:hypothetical protein
VTPVTDENVVLPDAVLQQKLNVQHHLVGWRALEGTVGGGWLRAGGRGRQCAPAALDGRFWAAPQLLR